MRTVAAITLLVLAACGDVTADLPDTTTTTELLADPTTEPTTTTVVPAPDSATTVTTVTTIAEISDDDHTKTSDPEYPEAELTDEMLDAIVRDAAERTGVDPAAVEIVSVTEEMFNDSSLGCPKPGEFYIQVITPGYLVIVRAGGAELDYRVGPSSWKLCEK